MIVRTEPYRLRDKAHVLFGVWQAKEDKQEANAAAIAEAAKADAKADAKAAKDKKDAEERSAARQLALESISMVAAIAAPLLVALARVVMR